MVIINLQNDNLLNEILPLPHGNLDYGRQHTTFCGILHLLTNTKQVSMQESIEFSNKLQSEFYAGPIVSVMTETNRG